MNKFICFCVGMLSLQAQALTVEWNRAFIVVGPDYDQDHDCYVTIGAPSFLPTLGDRISDGWRLTAIVSTYMEYANSFVIASYGDIVNAEYMARQTEFFSYSKFGDESSGRSDYYLDVIVDSPLYVAFHNVFETGVRYGWFQIGVNESGELEILSSAWDLDGDSIMVGAIPEPSTAMLLLIGCAGLSLRRRRGNQK